MIVHTAKRRIDWGHLALVTVLSGIVIWYLHDAWSASARVRNLILVLPASILSLTLALAIGVGVIMRRSAVPERSASDEASTREKLYPLILMAIFGLYILTLPVTGFDVGSALFVLVALVADGERRPLFLAVYPIAFAALCTLLFRWLLPYPMTTLIL